MSSPSRSRLVAQVIVLSLAAPLVAQADPPKVDAPAAKEEELPKPPEVSDPLLEPVPPATKVVSSWQDALALVRSRSVDFQVLMGDLERARGQTRAALAQSLPTLNGNLNVTNQLMRTTINPLNGERDVQFRPPHALTYGGSLGLTIPIFAPRAWHAHGTAKANEHVVELSLVDQKRALAATVASAMVTVITAERVADLNRSGLRLSLERLALAKRRSELGVATAVDVLRLEQDTNQARSSVVTGDESLRRAREALGNALGFAEAWGVPRDLSLDQLAKDSEKACPRAATVDERSDVIVADARVEVAKRGVKDVDLAFSPTVNIVTNYGATFQFFNSPTPAATSENKLLHTWTIAGVLSWNIFDGGARYGQLRDTRAQVGQAAIRAEGVRRTATTQVLQAARAVLVAEESLRVVGKTRELAREAERLTKMQFMLGRATSLELLDTARTLRDAEVQVALKELDIVDAKIRAMLSMATCEY